MQAVVCEVVRARMKFGIAMAASRPMIATTIMISTSVKPALRDVFIFILTLLYYARRERSNWRVISYRTMFTKCLLPSAQLLCRKSIKPTSGSNTELFQGKHLGMTRATQAGFAADRAAARRRALGGLAGAR